MTFNPDVGDPFCKALAETMAASATEKALDKFQELTLDGTGITADGVQAFTLVLQRLPALTTLHLDGIIREKFGSPQAIIS